MKETAPSADRNMEAIRLALVDLVPNSARQLLEIASGTGQHGAHIAPSLPHLSWWPCEHDVARLPSITAYAADTPNMMQPQQVDVMNPGWASMVQPGHVDVVLNINMIHITPWAACTGLLLGAGTKLVAGGRLMLYGPFRQSAVVTVQSNEDFDLWLRQRESAFGLRRLEEVETEAAPHGLRLLRVVAMPANNLLVAFEKAD